MRLRVGVVLVVVAATALAELPPSVYEDLQKNAPEALVIEVTSVDAHRRFAKPAGCPWYDFEVIRNVSVEARVVRVTRSAAGLRPGDVIRVEYSSVNRCSGFNGPRSIDVLHRGDRVEAYLARGDRAGLFVPAARGATFSAR